MSNKLRHTIIGFVFLTVLLLANTIVVIKFFTNEENNEITLSKATLNDNADSLSTKLIHKEESKTNKDAFKKTNELLENEELNNNQNIETTAAKESNTAEEIPEDAYTAVQVADIEDNYAEVTSRSAAPRESLDIDVYEYEPEIYTETEETYEPEYTEPEYYEPEYNEPQEESEPAIPANQVSIGTIEIPATGVNLPILKKVSVSGMEVATCYLYSTGSINVSGTTVIVGHNYCNGKLFSNNKYLNIGDTVTITANGIRRDYTIYDSFITTDDDVSYLDRNTSGEPQIALSTCTDNEERRLVILAK